MRTRYMISISQFVVAATFTCLHTGSMAELNLSIPKAVQNTSGEQPKRTDDFNLTQQVETPTGYQSHDRCPNGSRVTHMQNTNGKQFYKCERTENNMPPAVRDAERYERTPGYCQPGNISPQCNNIPRGAY